MGSKDWTGEKIRCVPARLPANTGGGSDKGSGGAFGIVIGGFTSIVKNAVVSSSNT